MKKPWSGMDPNSTHQLWARWSFRVYGGRNIPISEVRDNAFRWLTEGFGTAGRARVSIETGKLVPNYLIECEIEGKPAHDPDYIKAVRFQFERFVEMGWGITAWGVVQVEILAGDLQNGKPRKQLIVMPAFMNEGSLW